MLRVTVATGRGQADLARDTNRLQFTEIVVHTLSPQRSWICSIWSPGLTAIPTVTPLTVPALVEAIQPVRRLCLLQAVGAGILSLKLVPALIVRLRVATSVARQLQSTGSRRPG